MVDQDGQDFLHGLAKYLSRHGAPDTVLRLAKRYCSKHLAVQPQIMLREGDESEDCPYGTLLIMFVGKRRMQLCYDGEWVRFG